MPELSSAKTLGGVGSILLLLALAPWAGFVVSIIGWILVLVALKYVSEIINDKSVFNNAIYAVILSIIGLAIGGLAVLGSVFRFMGLNGYTFGSTMNPNVPPADVFGLILGVLAGLAAIWIFVIVSSIFLRRSLDRVSGALNVKMFGTAALLYLIGAVLTIVLVGFVLLFVAEILLVVAFFSIPDRLPMAPPSMPEPSAAPPVDPNPPPTR